MHPRRTTRQRRLAEVGDAGQARITASRAHVPGVGLAARVEAAYLAGAGVGTITFEEPAAMAAALATNPEIAASLSTASSESEAPSFAELRSGAREVAIGAWRALAEIARMLGDG